MFYFPRNQRYGRNLEDQLVQFLPYVGKETIIWIEEKTCPGLHSQAGPELIYHPGLSNSGAATLLLSSLAL